MIRRRRDPEVSGSASVRKVKSLVAGRSQLARAFRRTLGERAFRKLQTEPPRIHLRFQQDADTFVAKLGLFSCNPIRSLPGLDRPMHP
ncbi:hypothetical protein, partial [Mesorhizobium sp. M7A.F.Ca.US.002.01.1.1]|uniref:hypothetical protein n=1 Tax=Mesorhizobium sp. M7A.F.Ca.US.002.01.1.1 TaxID=2496700 RepID=UPI0019D41C0C